MIGTVPYLGLYFSDLTYIDSAHPNMITIEKSTNASEKLINFEKHRKEFEILAQIKLFQSAANAYTNLHSLPRFKAWFDTVRIYSDMERFVRSLHRLPILSYISAGICHIKSNQRKAPILPEIKIYAQEFMPLND